MITKEQIFQRLGHISVLYATLDFLTTVLLSDILNYAGKQNKKNSTKETTTLGVKLQKLKDLNESEVTSPSALKRLMQFIDEAIDIAKTRDRYLHDLWLFKEELLSKDSTSRLQLEIKNGQLSYVGTEHLMSDFNRLEKQLLSLQDKIMDVNKILNPDKSKSIEGGYNIDLKK